MFKEFKGIRHAWQRLDMAGRHHHRRRVRPIISSMVSDVLMAPVGMASGQRRFPPPLCPCSRKAQSRGRPYASLADAKAAGA